MTGFELLLPGLSTEDVRFAAAHGASDPDRAVGVTVDGARIRAAVLVARSTQPELRGHLVAVPGGTRVTGRLHYGAPLFYLLTYAAMFLAAGTFAAVLAARGEGTASALVGVAALVLLVITWLSLHAGVAHKDQDAVWLRQELEKYFEGAGST